MNVTASSGLSLLKLLLLLYQLEQLTCQLAALLPKRQSALICVCSSPARMLTIWSAEQPLEKPSLLLPSYMLPKLKEAVKQDKFCSL